MSSTDTVNVTTVLSGLVDEMCAQGGTCSQQWSESGRCAYYWMERGEITIFLGVTLEFGAEERLATCAEVYDCSAWDGPGYEAAMHGDVPMCAKFNESFAADTPSWIVTDWFTRVLST